MRILWNGGGSFVVRLGIERPGAGQVLDDVAEGFVDGNLVWGAAAGDRSSQDLTNFSDDVIVADQASFLGAEKFSALVEHALAAVGDEARAHHKIVVDLRGSGVTGADQVQMRAGTNPGCLQARLDQQR